MRTGRATYWQLTSLQAFWPGVQVSDTQNIIYDIELVVIKHAVEYNFACGCDGCFNNQIIRCMNVWEAPKI